jgi:hypothetical protein
MDGKRLPCGEIDLVGGYVGAGSPVMVIGECKNVDFTFIKDLGPERMRGTLLLASGQAQRKATWAALHWRRIVRMLELPEIEPTVLAFVVTRTIAAPAENGIPVFAIAELAGLADAIRSRPPHAWRGDLLAGVISAGERGTTGT